MAFVAGYDKSITFQASGSSLNRTIPVVSHSWKDKIDALDVTSTGYNGATGTAGVQALLAGILRGDGQITLCFDTALIIWGANANITTGTSGVMTFPVGTTNPFSVPCMITELGQTTKVEDKVMVDFAVRLNTLAGSYTRAS